MIENWIGEIITVCLFIIAGIGTYLSNEKKSKTKIHGRIDGVKKEIDDCDDKLSEHLIRHDERDK